MRRRGQRGSSLLESAMFLPVLFMLLFGMIELAKVAYTYYALQKVLYTVGRYVGTQRGINFCDDVDGIIDQAKQYAISGTPDGTESFIRNLQADQIQVRIERFDESEEIGECECSATGCDTGAGGRGPDYVVVSIPDGYPLQLAIPQVPLDPILLRPRVRLPFQGM
jgi:hypothetical protein